MTREAIKRSIYYAKQNLSEIENSPILSGYTVKRRSILQFISRMRRKLAKK